MLVLLGNLLRFLAEEGQQVRVALENARAPEASLTREGPRLHRLRRYPGLEHRSLQLRGSAGIQPAFPTRVGKDTTLLKGSVNTLSCMVLVARFASH